MSKLATSMVSLRVVRVLLCLLVFPLVMPIHAARAETGVLLADSALQQAMRNKDAKSAQALLDRRLEWTDSAGHTRMMDGFLRDVSAGADSGVKYAGLNFREYGALAIVTGTAKQADGEAFFVRFWVKRADRWALLNHQQTRILAKPTASASLPASTAAIPTGATAASDCENPCRSVPFKGASPAETDMVKAYQAVETAVTSHDPKTWAYHVADEFAGIGRKFTGVPDAKADRVGQIGNTSVNVVLPKMVSAHAFAFGNSGILIADHQPDGEKPFRVVRAWVNRDGRWQLFHRQETTIE